MGKIKTNKYVLENIDNNYQYFHCKPCISLKNLSTKNESVETFMSSDIFSEQDEIFINSKQVLAKILKIINSTNNIIYLYTTYIISETTYNNENILKQELKDEINKFTIAQEISEKKYEQKILQQTKDYQKQEEENLKTKKEITQKYNAGELDGFLYFKVPHNDGSTILKPDTTNKIFNYINTIIPDNILTAVSPLELQYIPFVKKKEYK